MSVDDRIRNALDASVARPDLDLEALDRAEADVRAALAGRRRRRHRTIVAAASALAAAAAVLVAVLVWPGPNHETLTTGPVAPSGSVAAGVGHLVSVAWPGNGAMGEVVIRSAATGRIERTWSSLPPSHAGGASLSATADGRYLYYGWQQPEKCISTDPVACIGGGIDRISLTDGAVTMVSDRPTYALAVSPDGRYLAAAQATRSSSDPTQLDTWHVTVSNLRTRSQRAWVVSVVQGPIPSTWRVTHLSFAPDNRHVAMSVEVTTFGSPTLRSTDVRDLSILDTGSPSSLSNPLRVQLPAVAGQRWTTVGGERWAAIYAGRADQLVALDWCGQPPCPEPARPVVIDVSTGRTRPLTGGLAPTDLPAADVSLAAGRAGVVYTMEPDVCPRCNGFSGWWAIYRITGGVATTLASGSDGPAGQGTVAPPPQGLVWIP